MFKLLFSKALKSYEMEESDEQIKALAREYKRGAILEIEDKLNQAEKELFFNGNSNMIADMLLFSLLEVKYKWQKL